jgi:hypothetical protein
VKEAHLNQANGGYTMKIRKWKSDHQYLEQECRIDGQGTFHNREVLESPSYLQLVVKVISCADFFSSEE